MTGGIEATATSPASPATVYGVLVRSGVVPADEVVARVPSERVDLRRPSSRFIADYYGRIELMTLADGGALIRWRVVFRVKVAGTAWLVRLLLRRSTTGLVRRLATFAADHDYDTPPY